MRDNFVQKLRFCTKILLIVTIVIAAIAFIVWGAMTETWMAIAGGCSLMVVLVLIYIIMTEKNHHE